MLSNHSPESAQRIRHHMRWGWHGLLIFGSLGTLLEILHAWKHPAYLGVGNDMRRLMWTLAHAHGIGLSLLHIAYAATLAIMFSELRPRLQRASRLLDASTLLMPLGFFLGGAYWKKRAGPFHTRDQVRTRNRFVFAPEGRKSCGW